MNAVAPMWMRVELLPATTFFAIERAFAIGIAYAWVASVERNVAPGEPAVSIPMTSPELFISGPPESPGTTLALTPIMPVRRTRAALVVVHDDRSPQRG